MRVRFVWIAVLILWAGLVPQAWAGFITLDVSCTDCGTVTNSAATGINNHGDIVGYFANGGANYYGFHYDGSTYSMISVPGALYTFPAGINDNGDVVGRYYDGTSYYGFLLPDGGLLQTLDLGPDTMVLGINNSGQYVGEVGQYPNISGFYWDGAQYNYFQVAGMNTALSGINNNGVIAGQYYLPSWTGAVSLDGGTTWVYPVPHPYPENNYGPLSAINDNGMTVGAYAIPGSYHGYYYDVNSATYSLFPDFPGSQTTWPLGINNSGYVVGYYQYPDGSYYAFEYVPEPSGLLLMAGGVLALLIRRLKR
jgi:hypothetical protein